MKLIILVSDCVFRVSDEFRVLEIGLELGQVHIVEWKVGDVFVGLPVWDGEIQTGNDGGMNMGCLGSGKTKINFF